VRLREQAANQESAPSAHPPATEFLPPLEPAEVFRALDPPAEIAELGDRARAEPGVVYRHQVERAIDAFVLAGQRESAYREKLDRLTRHADPRLRVHALLAYSSLPPGEIPGEELLRRAEDTAEPIEVREAAFLSHSFVDHPAVYVRLLEVAFEPEHDLRRIAASRLVDLDVGFALGRIAAFLEEHPALDDGVLRAGKARIEERVAARAAGAPSPGIPRVVPILLESAAWARASGSPLADELADWTVAQLAAEPSTCAKLLDWRYQPSVADPEDRALLEREVGRLVERILGNAAPLPPAPPDPATRPRG
jgi:hypothetical protein